MYEYLTGYVVSIDSKYIVLDVNGVGYAIYVSNPYHFHADSHQRVKIYVYQVVTDSSQTLYGFKNRVGKLIFEKLINVSGIGPKNAIAILSGNDQSALLNAINEENVTYLTNFPGVGKKTAKQIILDLKGKLNNLITSNPHQSNDFARIPGTSKELQEALSALENLGYSHHDVNSIKAQLSKKRGLNVNKYLSLGLKLLNRF